MLSKVFLFLFASSKFPCKDDILCIALDANERGYAIKKGRKYMNCTWFGIFLPKELVGDANIQPMLQYEA